MAKKITKMCISCNEEGHTYLECEAVPFFGLVAGAFGIPTKPHCGLNEEELVEQIKNERDKQNQ